MEARESILEILRVLTKDLIIFQYRTELYCSFSKKKVLLKALSFEHRLRGISLHLKDRQVGKEKIEGLGFTS